jgi:tetratricopeptide (TPR) repeat protein
METKYTEFIERYFDGLLSPEELRDFDRLKKTDQVFQEELDLFEKTHKALRLHTINSLKSEIRQIHKSTGTAKQSKVLPLIRYGIAASVLLLVGIGFFAQQYSNQNIYEESYIPVGDYITNMDNELSDLEKAVTFFDQQQFDSAVVAFQQIYFETGDQLALFYQGQSLYQKGELTQAIECLRRVSNNYEPEAQWYVALAYLKMDNAEKTLQVLDRIISKNEDEKFVLQAKTLKQKLQHPLRKLVF